jgi:esterase/lipase superfamily enzyme
LTDRKEVFLYVHGIQNSFADAVFAMSEIWHFMGREGVPITYTWPAGGGGLLRGYNRDRESGEFTTFHLKSFIRILASFPEVESLHIIAHSRGTDIFLTALRELLIAVRASNKNPLEVLKIQNVVLAAPDLDLSITMQRVAAEHLGNAVGRMTIYTSPNDKAISLAEFLFGGLIRLGQLDLLQVGDDLKQAAASGGTNLAIIEYTGSRSGSYGHSYFRENPAVSSDLILALRYDRNPGAKNGRPLKHLGRIFWQIDDDYLANAASSKSQ